MAARDSEPAYAEASPVTLVERQRLEQQRVIEVVDHACPAPGKALHGRDRQLLCDYGVE